MPGRKCTYRQGVPLHGALHTLLRVLFVCPLCADAQFRGCGCRGRDRKCAGHLLKRYAARQCTVCCLGKWVVAKMAPPLGAGSIIARPDRAAKGHAAKRCAGRPTWAGAQYVLIKTPKLCPVPGVSVCAELDQKQCQLENLMLKIDKDRVRGRLPLSSPQPMPLVACAHAVRQGRLSRYGH